MGATGGGYVLSKGVLSEARVTGTDGSNHVSVRVNGDLAYEARTTRRALSFLLKDFDGRFGTLDLDQRVDVPIGSGFGASAASALSAVYAAAAALGMDVPKSELARCAHDAEILEQTGLGTVSVICDGTGAGAITKAGPPGTAEFLNVPVPSGVRIVTATLAPFDKRIALDSRETVGRISRLGDEALERFLGDRTLDGLASAGEWFADRANLASPALMDLERTARRSGATHASQNMIGYAVHALAESGKAPSVIDALSHHGSGPRVDLFEVGSTRAGPL